MPTPAPIFLLLDAGNSRIKWALSSSNTPHTGPWLASGACTHAELQTLALSWQHAVHSLHSAHPRSIWMANVAGSTMAAALEQVVHRLWGVGCTVHRCTSQSKQGGLRNRYQHPEQLGADRWISAIGARHLYPEQPLLIATLGTATTLDAISPCGHFLGGLILPGLHMMQRALTQQTAELPALPEYTAAPASASPPFASMTLTALPDHPVTAPYGWADNTQDAMRNGCLTAQLGAILHTWHNFHTIHGAQSLLVLAGGAQHQLFPLLKAQGLPLRPHDNLVLTGLHVLARLSVDH